MSTSSPTIPPDVAAHVLHHYGHEVGVLPDTFTNYLLITIDLANDANMQRFEVGFPEYVAAVHAFRYDPDGVERLKDIAAGRCTRCKNDDGPNTASGLCEARARPMPLDGVA